MISLKNNNSYNSKIILILTSFVSIIILNILIIYFKNIIGNISPVEINPTKPSISIYYIMPLFISPIIEEIFFRKVIPQKLIKKGIKEKEADLITNLLFSVAHLNPFLIPYFINGLIYSNSFRKTNDITVPIIIHILYNTFVCLINFI